MVVLDIQYRNIQKFWVFKYVPDSLCQIKTRPSIGVIGPTGCDGYHVPESEPIPSTLNSESIYQCWSDYLLPDKTAKYICDVLMTYDNKYQISPGAIAQYPGVRWCRTQTIDDIPCDLPNAYESIVIWACSEQLDKMDPTTESPFESYPQLLNTRTISIWSSTIILYGYVFHHQGNGGIAGSLYGNYSEGIIPILELD